MLAGILDLLDLAHINRSLEGPSQTGYVSHRFPAGVKELMDGAIRDVKNCPLAKIVPAIVESQKAFTLFNIDGFLSVDMLSGMPARRDLSLHHQAASGGKSGFRGDHQSGSVILTRASPLQIFGPRHSWAVRNNLLNALGFL